MALQRFLVQTLANGAARMDESKLLVFIIGFLDQGRLQCMEDHAKRGGGRTRAFPHIAPAEQAGIEMLTRDIERDLQKGG